MILAVNVTSILRTLFIAAGATLAVGVAIVLSNKLGKYIDDKRKGREKGNDKTPKE